MRIRVARRTLLDLNQIPLGYEPDGPNYFGPPSRAARLASSRHVLNPQIGPPLAGVLADPAPERHLLETACDPMAPSLRDDVARHGRVLLREAACAGGTILGADDDPGAAAPRAVSARRSPEPSREVHATEHRLIGHPTPTCRLELDELVEAPRVLGMLHGDARPDVRAHEECGWEHATERRRPLRQQQPVERRRGGNQRDEARAGRVELAPGLVVALLADIRHRRAKDAATLAGHLGLAVPADRRVPVLLAKEAPGGVLAPYPVAEADRLRARITMIARRRDFDTAPPGIEGVMTPGDAGRLAHQLTQRPARRIPCRHA